MEQEIIKEVAGQAEGVLTEVYKDTLQPALQPVGQIISYPTRILRLAFSPIEKWLIGAETSLKMASDSVNTKLNDIPEEKVVPLDANIAVPAIMQLSYCENSEDLRDLYANLLATSMNRDKKWEVHPAFVDIIKQLTPDEAKFLKSLPPHVLISYPLIDVRITSDHGFNSILTNFTDTHIEVLENPWMISQYIDNLRRLGLIDIPRGLHKTDDKEYERVQNNEVLKQVLSNTIEGENIPFSYEHKIFQLTNLGVSFIRVCCKE